MKLRFKILAGFLLIIAMLAVAGAMSIYQFSSIGKSVEQLIEENYKTIEASRTMIKALEREDSGILLIISRQWRKGTSILDSADATFISALTIAKNNLTEKNENQYVSNIEVSYMKYKEIWESLIKNPGSRHDIEWYMVEVHENFLDVMMHVEALMNLNQESMYEEATLLKNQSVRAIMPGVVAIMASLVFLIIFNFFIQIFLIRPVAKLTEAIKSYHPSNNAFNADLVARDEFKVLENEIQKLTQRLKK